VAYEVPLLKDQTRLAGKVFGGWQTNFIFTAQTGNATQVTDGTGRSDSWSRFDRPDLVANPDFRAETEPKLATSTPMHSR